jgi:hypothetical protein
MTGGHPLGSSVNVCKLFVWKWDAGDDDEVSITALDASYTTIYQASGAPIFSVGGGGRDFEDSIDDTTIGGSMAPTLATNATTLTPSRAPPDLLQYVETIFEEHDYRQRGTLEWHELWWLFRGLGLGLTDIDIVDMQIHANSRGLTPGEGDMHAPLTFESFAPIALTLLRSVFDKRQWGRTHQHATPWVRIYDDISGCFYFYNCKTNASEWMSGDATQAAIVGTPLIIHKAVRRNVARSNRLARYQGMMGAGTSVYGRIPEESSLPLWQRIPISRVIK